MITYMSWIQTTADWLDITYIESLVIYLAVVFVVIWFLYCCCYLPCERCVKCLCCLPTIICSCLKRCILSEPVNAAFATNTTKNRYKQVQTVDIYDDESERGPMV